MQTDNEFIKIAVEIDGRQHLHKLHRSHSLNTVINNICKTHKKNNDTNGYGLKFSFTKDEKSLKKKYVTEENLAKLQDGWIVTLEKSVQNILDWIFNQKEQTEEKIKILPQLCEDYGVLLEIKKCNYQNLIPRWAMKFKEETHLQHCCLQSVYNLLLNNVPIDMNNIFLDFLLEIIKTSHNNNKILITSLQIVNQMLVQNFGSEYVISKLQLTDIDPYLWSEETYELQLHTLILLNNIVRRSVDKNNVIKKLHENKERVFKYVTENAIKHKNIAHELCVYQTTLLRSLYRNYYEEETMHEDNYSVVLRSKSTFYEQGKRDTMVDFEEKDGRNRLNTYNSGSSVDFQRLSRFNSREDQLDGISLRSKSFSVDSLDEPSVYPISTLTSMCIDYYRLKYEKSFTVSVLEACYNPGFSQICNQIVNMLCDILFISKDPTEEDVLYIPVIFSVYMRDQFFEELFCRTIWNLAKTRREMRAKVDEDHDKVLAVLKEQLSITLHKHPMKFKQINEEIKKITYKDVFEIWEKERNQKWNTMISTAPVLNNLRKELLVDVKKLIKTQRLKVLQKGEVFPKLPEKKGKQLYWFISLNKNNTKLEFGDYDPDTDHFTSAKTEVSICKIEHIATGKAAKCVKEQKVRRPDLVSRCFSLLYENEGCLDFLAPDELTAQYWIDGLHLLLGKSIESTSYKADVDMLLTMDLNMRLLELQNVPIPAGPPPIPRSPKELKKKHQYEEVDISEKNEKTVIRVKPEVPPKTEQLRQTIAYRKLSQMNLIDQ